MSSQQLLIANPDEDILSLFVEFFRAHGLNSSAVKTGENCIQEVRKRSKKFVAVIIDSDIDVIELARKILELIPHQRIIITTAYSDQALTREAGSIGIESENILFEPFELSKLWSAVIKN